MRKEAEKVPTTVSRFGTPTLAQLRRVQKRYERDYGGDVFYPVATELIELARQRRTKIRISEALAALLLAWNRQYYRFHQEAQRHLVADLDDLLRQHGRRLDSLRSRSIESFLPKDEKLVRALFGAFEAILGRVGAAKALHLLAPRFFPLWDAGIAAAYGFRAGTSDQNGERYLRFMHAVKAQCEQLGGERRIGGNPLKALDEYNICCLRGPVKAK